MPRKPPKPKNREPRIAELRQLVLKRQDTVRQELSKLVLSARHEIPLPAGARAWVRGEWFELPEKQELHALAPNYSDTFLRAYLHPLERALAAKLRETGIDEGQVRAQLARWNTEMRSQPVVAWEIERRAIRAAGRMLGALVVRHKKLSKSRPRITTALLKEAARRGLKAGEARVALEEGRLAGQKSAKNRLGERALHLKELGAAQHLIAKALGILKQNVNERMRRATTARDEDAMAGLAARGPRSIEIALELDQTLRKLAAPVSDAEEVGRFVAILPAMIVEAMSPRPRGREAATAFNQERLYRYPMAPTQVDTEPGAGGRRRKRGKKTKAEIAAEALRKGELVAALRRQDKTYEEIEEIAEDAENVSNTLHKSFTNTRRAHKRFNEHAAEHNARENSEADRRKAYEKFCAVEADVRVYGEDIFKADSKLLALSEIGHELRRLLNEMTALLERPLTQKEAEPVEALFALIDRACDRRDE